MTHSSIQLSDPARTQEELALLDSNWEVVNLAQMTEVVLNVVSEIKIKEYKVALSGGLV